MTPTGKDTRELLFRAAYVLFHERGFDDVRMSEVAEKAGMSVGSVYNYFESKEVLCEAVVACWLRNMAPLLRGASGIQGMWRVWQDMTQRNPEFARWLVRPLGEEARAALVGVGYIVNDAVSGRQDRHFMIEIRHWIGLLGEPDADYLFAAPSETL